MVKEKETARRASVGSTKPARKTPPRKASAAANKKKTPAGAPPSIITVDASQKVEQPRSQSNQHEDKQGDSQPERRDADASSLGQAQTPKHANKTTTTTAGGTRDDPSPPPSEKSNSRDSSASFNKRLKEEEANQPPYRTQEKIPFPSQQLTGPPPPQGQQYSQFAAPPPFDRQHRPPGPDGAFAPRPPFQGQYYPGSRGGPPLPISPGVYPPGFAGPPGGQYRPYADHPSAGQPAYSRQQQYGPHLPNQQTRYSEQPTGGVTRAVSSSFEHMNQNYFADSGNASVPDDDSWKQLKQVTSVDENAMQARLLGDRATPLEDKEKDHPASNSSSLTNSPVEGAAADSKPANPSSKLTSLDSLSSVASAQEKIPQEKIRTAGKDGKQPKGEGSTGHLSPGSASAAESLDLMKCHSGSSGLLHGFPGGHQRGASLTSVHIPDDDAGSKRSLEERGPSTDQPAAKRSRLEQRDAPPAGSKASDAKKGSPLSIACSPPGSPNKQKKQETKQAAPDSGIQQYVDAQQRLTASPGRFQLPSYTYSIDSAGSRERVGPTGLPQRPSSSSSSTTGVLPGEANVREGLSRSLPSWEIHGQDSFGAASSGPLMPNFSFTQDYPTLTHSGSNIGYDDGKLPPQLALQQAGLRQPPFVTETRNQSFEGGHYHGSFDRSNSMDMGPPQTQGGPPGPYKGPFPPQAPSWGSASSTPSEFQRGPPPPGVRFQAGRMPARPMILRVYSEDNGARTSPPAGPNQSGFQPPPSDFAAPTNSGLTRRAPPRPVYLMSSGPSQQGQVQAPPKRPPATGSGVYGWSKDDDDRLTLVMKKHKNPRDWEPIAREHGRGKTAKDCMERWIRYLKPGVRKGQWQDYEDAIVMEAVTSSAEQPFTRWSELAQRLPGRVGKQIRDRWVNHLNPHINHMPFSKEDDLLLWEGHKVVGKRWVEISTKFFNNSRSENHIKNRWYSASFKKFITNEFGPNAYTGGKDKKKKSTPAKE